MTAFVCNRNFLCSVEDIRNMIKQCTICQQCKQSFYKPVASKSRNYSDDDKKFIALEVQRLYKEGIIESSTSPWRSQVVVTKREQQKKHLAINYIYSEIINRFTQLDAHPFPKVDDIINKIAKYRYFTTTDLKSAYHQIPLREEPEAYITDQRLTLLTTNMKNPLYKGKHI